MLCHFFFFFFQAEDGIRDLVRSRGLGDVYKRQVQDEAVGEVAGVLELTLGQGGFLYVHIAVERVERCLLYTSDAADDLLCVDLGGRRIIKKKKNNKQ